MKVALLFLAVIIGVMGKLEFVSELSRHGARAPGGIYNYTIDPEENFKVPMELSNVGMRQHYLIGTQVRKTYIEEHKLISSTYNWLEILFYSTDRTRTLESGMSQISGIFPPSICQQTLNDFQQKNAVPPLPIEDMDKIQKELKEKALPKCYNVLPIISEMNAHSYDIQPQDSDCAAYQKVSDELCNSEEQKKLKEPFLNYLIPTFNKVIGPGAGDDAGSICSYLLLADFHKFDLYFDWWNQTTDEEYLELKLNPGKNIKKEILMNCDNLDNAGLYCKSYGDERLYKIGAKKYLDKLIESMDKIIAKNETQKMELNFSHDTSTAIILSGLGYITKQNPPLASTLFIELHNEDGEYHVQAFYNGKAIKYGLCQELKCKYSTFVENAKERTFPGTIEDVCNGKFSQ